jgi:hypothetical protein
MLHGRTARWWVRHIWWNAVQRPINNRCNRRRIVAEWIAEGRSSEQIAFARRMGCAWISLDCIRWAEGQAALHVAAPDKE